MQIVICPGIHPPHLTDQFVAAFPGQLTHALVAPVAPSSAYAGWEILPVLLNRLRQGRESQNGLCQDGGCSAELSQAGLSQAEPSQVGLSSLIRQTPILLIGFSAGVVGAAILASFWQKFGGRVVALIALDGWGVPLGRSFPVHRVSHDPFTHWSSALLGAGQANFYASPAVGHLDLWRSPQVVQGWGQVNYQGPYRLGTAALFISQWLAAYQTAYQTAD